MAEPEGIRGRILVADDDGPLRRLFQAVLGGQGHTVEAVADGEAARERISQGDFDVLLLDLTIGPVGGLALLDHTRAVSPDAAVVIITGNATVETAVEALKRGAYDYLVKPVQNERLVLMVRRLLEMKRIGDERRRTGEALKRERQRSASLMRGIRERHALSRLAGLSARMNEVRALVTEVCRTDSTVLILGESGTGKSFLARTIHFNSCRAEQPFIETNCAVYAEGVLMSELFGHEIGAFTGAIRRKKGRFELAEGGTVFLDEIGDIPAATQVSLLRFLQERCFERVGGEETIQADVRVIAATNRDLSERLRSGAFREDLFYRLNVIPITLPPLRERSEDIPLLASRILSECAARLKRPGARFSADAVAALQRYSWPGNIRDMENAIERAVLLTPGEVITSGHLPSGDSAARPPEITPASVAVPDTLEDNERHHILQVLQRCRWNKKQAAAALGINRSSLYSKLKRFGPLDQTRRGARASAAGGHAQEDDTR